MYNKSNRKDMYALGELSLSVVAEVPDNIGDYLQIAAP